MTQHLPKLSFYLKIYSKYHSALDLNLSAIYKAPFYLFSSLSAITSRFQNVFFSFLWEHCLISSYYYFCYQPQSGSTGLSDQTVVQIVRKFSLHWIHRSPIKLTPKLFKIILNLPKFGNLYKIAKIFPDLIVYQHNSLFFPSLYSQVTVEIILCPDICHNQTIWEE